MIIKVTGKIGELCPLASGVSARGEWVSRDVVIEMVDGNYTTSLCARARGERVREVEAYPVGSMVEATISVRSTRSTKGTGWWTDLTLLSIAAAGSAQPAPAPVQASNSAPQPAANSEVESDLPF